MGKFPYAQFYYADFSQDTDILSNQAVGGWLRILCPMWHHQVGYLTGDWQYWARVLRCNPHEAQAIITELQQQDICNFSEDGHGNVTLMSRRLMQEYQDKEKNKLRKQRQREKQNGHANVTLRSRKGHTKVTTHSQSQSQKSEPETSGSSKLEHINSLVEDTNLKATLTNSVTLLYKHFSIPINSEEIVKLTNKILKEYQDLDLMVEVKKFHKYNQDNTINAKGLETFLHKWMNRAREFN